MVDVNLLQDRLDVHELYSRYAVAIDNNQGDEWVSCFTEDGSFDLDTATLLVRAV